MRGLDGGRPKVQDSVDGWNGVGVYVQPVWKCGRGGGKALFEVAHHTLQSERLSECRAVRASMWHSPLVTIRWHGGSKKGVHERRGDLDPGLLITRCIVFVDEHEDAQVSCDHPVMYIQHRDMRTETGLLCLRQLLICTAKAT